MNEFRDKVAVVTGGANGIGRSVVEALVDQGATVAVVDVDADAGGGLAADLGSGGAQVRFFPADVSTRADVDDCCTELLGEFGHIDTLVQCVGVQRYGTVVDTDEAVWDEVMRVNVKSMYLMARRLMPVLEQRRGTVVNVGSIQSLVGWGRSAAYVTSKHAILGLTRAMAADHAPSVRVNCVAPGSVDTPMLRGAAVALGMQIEEAVASWGALHPLKRIATAGEVAEAILFLAGPRSSFITGACLSVDGGLAGVK